jgi:hypothetical protein
LAAIAIEPSTNAAAVNVIVIFRIKPSPRVFGLPKIAKKHYSAATTQGSPPSSMDLDGRPARALPGFVGARVVVGSGLTGQTDFEVEQWAIGGRYYVRATLPDGTAERIEGFATEGEAGRWIEKKSVAWLHERRKALRPAVKL